MKITKIIHRATRPNDDGLWLVWAQVYINGNFRYTCLDFPTWEEAAALQEGQMFNN